jgi:hypothetical protein
MDPILRETNWFTMSENGKLIRICGPESEEFTGEGRKLHNE